MTTTAKIPWRCFHCDFITTDREEAAAHFGDRDDPAEYTPICKWWSMMGDDERAYQLQTTIQELDAERGRSVNLEAAVRGALKEAAGRWEEWGSRAENVQSVLMDALQ